MNETQKFHQKFTYFCFGWFGFSVKMNGKTIVKNISTETKLLTELCVSTPKNGSILIEWCRPTSMGAKQFWVEVTLKTASSWMNLFSFSLGQFMQSIEWQANLVHGLFFFFSSAAKIESNVILMEIQMNWSARARVSKKIGLLLCNVSPFASFSYSYFFFFCICIHIFSIQVYTLLQFTMINFRRMQKIFQATNWFFVIIRVNFLEWISVQHLWNGVDKS